MKSNKQARHDAKALFQACRINGSVDEAKARQAVQQVATQKPRRYGSILAHFRRLLRLEVERRTARVESAVPLSAAQQSTAREHLARRYGSGLDIIFSQNPALLGGVRIQVGSDVFDGSMKGRLRALAEKF